jgi:uncharacterized membrane protein YedE/YeeE
VTANLATAGTLALGRQIPRQHVAAVVVLLFSAVLGMIIGRTDPALGALWFLGMAAGFTLQRSRLCFASAFRDLFLFGSARTMKAIIVGLVVATIGFALIMRDMVPFPGLSVLPAEAHILPFGISTVIGGLLFGVGMVLAGGCVSGSLYRMAEGYIGSWVALGGVIVGLGLMAQTWNVWWDLVISNEPRIWLPDISGLGYVGGVVLTLAGLLGVFILLIWWEARSGVPPATPTIATEEPGWSFSDRLRSIWRSVFVRGWPVMVGGAVLGGLVVLMYVVFMPWGVTGEFARWALHGMTAIGIPAPLAKGLSEIGGCAARAVESGTFTHAFVVGVGLFPGAMVGALFAREFKLRFPRQRRRYVQSLVGGIVMGYGAGLAIGCTIGAFFSAIPSLSLSGWLFAPALAGGAFIGVQFIKRAG